MIDVTLTASFIFGYDVSIVIFLIVFFCDMSSTRTSEDSLGFNDPFFASAFELKFYLVNYEFCPIFSLLV